MQHASLITTFLSLQANDWNGWDIVQKTFPQRVDGITRFSILTTEIGHHYADKTKAKVQALRIAIFNNLTFVNDMNDVMTIAAHDDGYVPMSISKKNELFCKGSFSDKLETALAKAHEIADKNLSVLVAPIHASELKPLKMPTEENISSQTLRNVVMSLSTPQKKPSLQKSNEHSEKTAEESLAALSLVPRTPDIRESKLRALKDFLGTPSEA